MDLSEFTHSFMSALYREAFLDQYHRVPRLSIVMTETQGVNVKSVCVCEEAVLCETEGEIEK